MSLLANVLGFGAFGFMTRTLQLGILKREIFEGPHTHLATAAVFGVAGWGVYELEQKQRVMLDGRKAILIANRDKENAEYQAKKKNGSADEGGH